MIDETGFVLYHAHLLAKWHRRLAQPGSASGLGPEGRRFEPCIADHLRKGYAPLAQLDRATAF